MSSIAHPQPIPRRRGLQGIRRALAARLERAPRPDRARRRPAPHPRQQEVWMAMQALRP